MIFYSPNCSTWLVTSTKREYSLLVFGSNMLCLCSKGRTVLTGKRGDRIAHHIDMICLESRFHMNRILQRNCCMCTFKQLWTSLPTCLQSTPPFQHERTWELGQDFLRTITSRKRFRYHLVQIIHVSFLYYAVNIGIILILHLLCTIPCLVFFFVIHFCHQITGQLSEALGDTVTSVSVRSSSRTAVCSETWQTSK